MWKAIGVAVAGFMAILVLGAVIFGISLWSFYDTAKIAENGIVAQWDQNRNNYDNYWKKLKEAAQVPAMYSDDLKKIFDSAMQGRYGKDGSKAVFQWIQEHNPTVDASLYKKVQDIIEAGRNGFEADQKSLVSKRQAYQNSISTAMGGLKARILGFPKIDLTKYDIVTSDETEEVFKTKKAPPVKLRE